jgi:hypothetical protein
VKSGRFPSPSPPEGIAGPAGALPVLGADLASAQDAAFDAAGLARTGTGNGSILVREDVYVRPEAVAALLRRGVLEKRDLSWRAGGRLGELSSQLAFGDEGPWLVYLHQGHGSPEQIANAPVVEFDPHERVIDLAVPKLQFGTDKLSLPISDLLVLPAGHWVQLLWANLLGLGPHLWRAVGGANGPARAARIALAAMGSMSLEPMVVGRQLVRRGSRCRVHPRAVVEASWLGDDVSVGANAVVRGCVLGDGAVVEELAVVEGSVLSPGARVQRQALFKFSLAAPGAAAAGAMQLGVLGRDAAAKYGAVFMDMTMGQGVKVSVGGALWPAPLGLAGVCVGDRTLVGTGVQVAPGRALPADLVVLGGGGDTVVRIPAGLSGTVRVVGGVLVSSS